MGCGIVRFYYPIPATPLDLPLLPFRQLLGNHYREIPMWKGLLIKEISLVLMALSTRITDSTHKR